jgi:hypothetical protein
MTALRTYLGDTNLKAAFLAEITKHEEQDALVKGSYGEMDGSFKGCAIGCSLHSLNVLQGKTGKASTVDTGNHRRYEAELGLPIWLAYLEDQIFETLPDEFAVTWPRQFAEAIPVGAVVTDRVLAQILVWSLTDAEFGVRFATDEVEVRGWIDAVAVCIEADSKGEATADQREAAARAAWDAWAAWAARAAWAAWAARDARDARAAWAAWAARAAATNSSRGKADAFSIALSEFVLTLLRDLPAGEAIRV